MQNPCICNKAQNEVDFDRSETITLRGARITNYSSMSSPEKTTLVNSTNSKSKLWG
jgi:hypothetical protein